MPDFLGAKFAEQDYKEYLRLLCDEYLYKLYPKSIAEQAKEIPLWGKAGLRRQLGERSVEFFARAYHPEYFEFPVGWFHERAYAEITGLLRMPPSRARMARAWPRGYAKSTIFNFFTPEYASLNARRAFTLELSDTETQALGFLNDIRTSCEGNDHVLTDYGDIRGSIWRSDLLTIENAQGRSIIMAAGAESSILGTRKAQNRPSLVILDDLEDLLSVQTVERINKRHNWLMRTLMPIGNARTDFIYVGTILSYDCVFDRILNSHAWDAQKFSSIITWSESPLWTEWKNIYTNLSKSKEEREQESFEFYEEHKDELLHGTEVLWPEGKPYITLMREFTEIGDLAFQAEYQNEPINPADCIFDKEWFKYYDDDTFKTVNIIDVVGAVDPSLGKTRLSDFTAIITVGRGDDGYIYVLDAVIERMPPDRIVETILQKAQEYKYTRFGVEVNLFQELLRLQLIREAQQRRIFLPTTEVKHNKDKVLRVQTLVPYIKNGFIRFRKNQLELLNQLGNFPKGRYDDGPDCLETAVRLLGRGTTHGSLETGIDPTGRRYRRFTDDDDDYVHTRSKFDWINF